MSESMPTTKPVMHRARAAAFVFVAAASLPWLVTLALESGILAGIQAVIFGASNASRPPTLPLGGGVIVWAWTVFFVALAFVCGTEKESKTGAATEPEPASDRSVTEMESASPQADRATGEQVNEPAGQLLPEVQSLRKAQVWFGEGTKLYGQCHFEEANARFDRALELCPRLASAWAGKGLASNALGQFGEAIRCYDEALRLDPRDPAVWHDKGNTLIAMGRLEGALNCFNEALILDPQDARAWNNKGGCLASLGRLDDAIACYDSALSLNPSYALAWYARGVIEERLGHLESALTAFRQFLRLGVDQDAAIIDKVRQHVSGLETASQPGTGQSPDEGPAVPGRSPGNVPRSEGPSEAGRRVHQRRPAASGCPQSPRSPRLVSQGERGKG
jgi:Flp pilus assembly protein TadD